MVHSVSGWARGVQQKLTSLEKVCHTWVPERCVHDKALYKSTFTLPILVWTNIDEKHNGPEWKRYNDDDDDDLAVRARNEDSQTDLGKLDTRPHFSIQNRRGPLLPRSAANPSNGMLDVPVTNCSRRSRRSLSYRSTTFQNHSITWCWS